MGNKFSSSLFPICENIVLAYFLSGFDSEKGSFLFFLPRLLLSCKKKIDGNTATEVVGTVILMSSLALTIQVLGLSSKVTLGELNTFFSYCGTVEEIQLQKNKDLSKTALVTFTQPYAFQTALLLNDAVFAGQPIRILPAKDLANSPTSDELTNDNKMHGIIPAMQEIASKGCEVLNKTKEEIEEKYKLSEKGRFIMEHTRSLICDAEQAAQQIGAKIVNHDYVSTTANWLSSAVNKVNLGTRKRNNHNSRKQK